MSRVIRTLKIKMEKGFYHISSRGLERNDIFKSREDFIAGMNDIAITLLRFDLRILCFCLMSNHFHFVLYGTLDECRHFSEEYKRKCAIRMRRHNGDVKGMRDVSIQINMITGNEYLENVIVYVLRNPLAAGIILMPFHYCWSSAAVYFCGDKTSTGKVLNDMPARKRWRILESRQDIPDHYVVNDEGMILPSCYVAREMVEKIFRHPSRLMMALARKVENDVAILFGAADSVSMTDQEILTELPSLLKKEFGKESLAQLSMEQRIMLCLNLNRNFKAGIKQIARLTHLSPELISAIV